MGDIVLANGECQHRLLALHAGEGGRTMRVGHLNSSASFGTLPFTLQRAKSSSTVVSISSVPATIEDRAAVLCMGACSQRTLEHCRRAASMERSRAWPQKAAGLTPKLAVTTVRPFRCSKNCCPRLSWPATGTRDGLVGKRGAPIHRWHSIGSSVAVSGAVRQSARTVRRGSMIAAPVWRAVTCTGSRQWDGDLQGALGKERLARNVVKITKGASTP